MGNGRLAFVGVTASRSSINRVFPRWADILGLDADLLPLDLPLDTSPQRYREVMMMLHDTAEVRGALVTTHKVRLLEAASDLFHELDEYADLCHEVSCIVKRDNRLLGSAKDPITAGRALWEFLPRGHFGTTGGHVVCLGAGGSGLALSIHLLTRPDVADRPRRIVLVNRSPQRLEVCRAVHARLGVPAGVVTYVASAQPERNDQLVSEAPPGSLVVNATGMGKDLPGSPVTDDAIFPADGYAWEFNYRGDLDFLHQARRQATARNLTVEDGWRYFVHGWSTVIAEVFGVDLSAATLTRLSAAAADLRPAASG